MIIALMSHKNSTSILATLQMRNLSLRKFDNMSKVTKLEEGKTDI